MAALDKTNHDEVKTDRNAVLQRASVPGMGNVYILGYGAKQVTIYSQQVRALKLLWALDRKSQLVGKSVAIIGGGIAGVTAASAALVLQANVTVLERNEELLHLQRGCHSRYLHPAIYEWPERIARRASANLPIVNWTVGKASDVATQILAEYRRIKSRAGAKCTEIENARDVQINSSGTVVSWRGKSRGDESSDPHILASAKFDAIILAVGFGVEKTVNDLPSNSYWRVDSLTQTALDSQDDNYVVLVSGVGDGGTIDVLRAKLREFDHGGFLDECVLRLESISSTVNDFEDRMQEEYKRLFDAKTPRDVIESRLSQSLHEGYSELAELDVVDDLLKEVRAKTKVIWIGTTRFPASPATHSLNRVLAWRLWHQGAVEYRQGRIAAVRNLDQESVTGYRYAVELNSEPFRKADDFTIHSHQVVLRHGPASEVSRSFPTIADAMATRDLQLDLPSTPEKLPEDVRQEYVSRSRWVYTPRTTWRDLVRLRARPEGGPVHRKDQDIERDIYRIRIWLESTGGLEHVDWVDYDLHPEYGAVQRRATRQLHPQSGEQFRHWINTWDDFWLRVRCSDGSEYGKWVSTAIEETINAGTIMEGKSEAWACVRSLQEQASALRKEGKDYRARGWCDYVDLPWLSIDHRSD